MKALFTLLTILIVQEISFAIPINSFINTVYPSMNAVSVNKYSNIEIQFVQSMNYLTLNNSTIKVFGYQSGLLDVFVSYNSSSKTVVINPARDYKPGEFISVTVTSGIQTAGAVSIEPLTYTFTVKTTGGMGTFTKKGMIDSASYDYLRYGLGENACGDVDGDNDLDIISSNYFRTNVYLNDGAANFTLHSTINRGQNIILADFNNDTFLDLILQRHLDFGPPTYVDTMFLFLNNGTGNFIFANYFIGRIGPIGDLNNDGYIDLSYFYHYNFLATNDSIIIQKNNNGNFSIDTTLLLPFSGMGDIQFDLKINDFNNDGKLDMIIEKDRYFSFGVGFFRDNKTFSFVKNTGSSNYTSEIFDSTSTLYSEGPEYNKLGALTTFDFNNDGLNDVIYSDNKFLNSGNASFLKQNSFQYYFKSMPGDFNADGYLDVIAGNNSLSPETQLTVYINDGFGSFGTQHNSDFNFHGNSVGDFDNDGDLDVATLERVAGNLFGVSILLNNNCLTPSVNLSGPENISLNSSGILYSAAASGGRWEISNIPPCNASIAGSDDDDSVYVNAGSVIGKFNLYYNFKDSCGTSLNKIEVNVDIPLPIELLSFTSSTNGRDISLYWATSTEENNSGFEVERTSIDDHWTEVGFVKGHGNSNIINNYSFTDKNLNSGRYKYRLRQIDYNGIYKYYDLQNEAVLGVPEKFSLSQNYPNPFNPSTKINFDLPVDSKVSLKIFDIKGMEIKTIINSYRTAGYYTVNINVSELPSGVYFYMINTERFVSTKKMVLIK